MTLREPSRLNFHIDAQATGSRARADVGLELGAEHAIDYTTQDIHAEIMKITKGKGIDVLYDNIANPKVLTQAFMAC